MRTRTLVKAFDSKNTSPNQFRNTIPIKYKFDTKQYLFDFYQPVSTFNPLNWLLKIRFWLFCVWLFDFNSQQTQKSWFLHRFSDKKPIFNQNCNCSSSSSWMFFISSSKRIHSTVSIHSINDTFQIIMNSEKIKSDVKQRYQELSKIQLDEN